MARYLLVAAALLIAIPAWAGCDEDDPDCKPTPSGTSKPKPKPPADPQPKPPEQPSKPPPVESPWTQPEPAKRGCEMDTDCKGDRVCARGVCVDPDAPPPERTPPKSTQGYSQRDLEKAADTVGEMDTGIATAWIVFGVTAPIGIAGPVAGLANVQTVPEVLGGLGTVGAAIAGPVAAAPGAKGRTALKRLRVAAPGGAGRTAAWVTYGVGMASAVGVVSWAIADQGADYLAVNGTAMIPIALCSTSVILFQSDASRVRAQLAEVLDDNGIVVEARSAPPRPRFALGPTADPVKGQVGIALAGTW